MEKDQNKLGSRERLWTTDFIKLNASNFMLFFSFYLLMPLLPIYLSEAFGAGKHEIGAVLSGYTIMALVARPIAGFIVDSYDRKKVLVLVYGFFFLMFSGYLVAGTLVGFTILRTLHGAPFGMSTVANSTAAIDALLSSRRSEGIGYYGLSNNLAMASAPSVALYLYDATGSMEALFTCSFVTAFVGWLFCLSIHPRERNLQEDRNDVGADKSEKRRISFDRFFLVAGWPEALVMAALAFSYGVLSTYIAIYSKQELGMVGSSGTFFLLLACGLMASRIVGGRTLRKGMAVQNAQWGMVLSLIGYSLFAAGTGPVAYYASAIIVGLGNGHMFPGMQTMFINMAPHSRRGTANATQLTSWDAGIGLGVIVGGGVAELMGYRAAFVVAALVNAVGVLYFRMRVRGHYARTMYHE